MSAPSTQDSRRNRLRPWLGRGIFLALIVLGYVVFWKLPWPAAGWYYAPPGQPGPAMTYLLWNGYAYQFPEGSDPQFLGWYRTQDGETLLTNVHGSRVRIRSWGWGGHFAFEGGPSGYAYREWRPKVWWELRQRPLPEPPREAP